MSWLKKQWHRFTLGRTARAIRLNSYGRPGSAANLARLIDGAAERGLPAGVVHEVVTRQALDLPPGVVRIVLETWQ